MIKMQIFIFLTSWIRKKAKSLSLEDISIYSFLLLFLVAISYLYYQKATSFSFVDEYNSFIRAYFMQQGKELYRDIFSHHQPITVYISYVLQVIINPSSLYSLVLIHRLFIIIFSFCMAFLLVLRFKKVGALFVLLFEFTKYYLFGNLFLGESLIVYPLVYSLGVLLGKLAQNAPYKYDYLLVGGFAWFIVFTREAHILAVLLIYGLVLWGKTDKHEKIISVLIFLILSIIIMLTTSFRDYFNSVVTLNLSGYVQNELDQGGVKGIGILKVFFYPLLIFIPGNMSEIKQILIVLSTTFLGLITFLIYKKKHIRLIIFITVILGLLLIRYVPPGNQYFNGFKLLPWYGSFIFAISFLYFETIKFFKKPRYIILIPILMILMISQPLLLQHHDRVTEFTQNYGRQYVAGEVIKTLSDSDDTMMIDYWNTLVYWQAGLKSSYEYSTFWPIMTSVSKYSEERQDMFNHSPPDFYYVACSDTEPIPLSKDQLSSFVRLFRTNGKPSCIFVNNEKLKEIDDKQWESVKAHGIKKP